MNGQSLGLRTLGEEWKIFADGHFFGAARGGSLWRGASRPFLRRFLRHFRVDVKRVYAPFGLVHVTVLVDGTVVAVRVAAAAVVLVIDELRQIDIIFPR